MNDLVKTLRSGRVLLMDGAMGTELMRWLNASSLECGVEYNLSQPELIRSIHREYVEAGADVLLTNTFQANPAALARFGLAGRHHDIWQEAIRLARFSRPRFVLADVGPIDRGEQEIFASIALECNDVDGVLLETWTSLMALKQAADLLNARQLPFLASFTFHRLTDLQTFGGDRPENCAHAAAFCGASALGANCGKDIGLADMLEIVRRYRAVCDLPIFVRPNAGTPIWTEASWVYPETPKGMAAGVRALVDAGVAMVGGCCGTTPQHIAAFRKVIDSE